MQVMSSKSAVSVHQGSNSCSATELAEIAGKFEEDFSLKLKLNEATENELESLKDEKPLHEEERQVEEEDEEFSFACLNPDGSPITADCIFQDGQIRPFFPLFNRDLLFADDSEAKRSSVSALRLPLRKVYVEERVQASSASSSEADEPEGPFCVWERKAVEASPEVCKKSNSTGFSKLRRFRELLLRSNSDGKDAFVFLNHQNHNNNPSSITESASTKTKKAKESEKGVEKKRTPVAKNGGKAPSAHERLYLSNRAMKEEHKRKSYLPYRVGFFTYANGLTGNVHPY